MTQCPRVRLRSLAEEVKEEYGLVMKTGVERKSERKKRDGDNIEIGMMIHIVTQRWCVMMV